MSKSLKGLAIGFFVTGALAFFLFVIGVALFGEPGSDFVQYGLLLYGSLIGLSGGVMGAVIGAVVGAVLDWREQHNSAVTASPRGLKQRTFAGIAAVWRWMITRPEHGQV